VMETLDAGGKVIGFSMLKASALKERTTAASRHS